jgi:hypothetical protein
MDNSKCFTLNGCSTFLPNNTNIDGNSILIDELTQTLNHRQLWPHKNIIINFSNDFPIKRDVLIGKPDNVFELKEMTLLANQKNNRKPVDIELEQALQKITNPYGIIISENLNQRFRYIIENRIKPHCAYLNFQYINYKPGSIEYNSMLINPLPNDVSGIVMVVYEQRTSENTHADGYSTITGYPDIYEQKIFMYNYNQPVPGNNFIISMIINNRDYRVNMTLGLHDIRPFCTDLQDRIKNVFGNRHKISVTPIIDILDPQKLNILISIRQLTEPLYRASISNNSYDESLGIPIDGKLDFLEGTDVDGSKFYTIILSPPLKRISKLSVIENFKSDTIIHEFLHILGMVHTHQTFEATSIIQWNDPKLRKNLSQTIKDPVSLEKVLKDNYTDTYTKLYDSFDRDSIMVYSIEKGDTINNIIMNTNFIISKGDIGFLVSAYSIAGLKTQESFKIAPESRSIQKDFFKNNQKKELKINESTENKRNIALYIGIPIFIILFVIILFVIIFKHK